jgi:hypothetical protein
MEMFCEISDVIDYRMGDLSSSFSRNQSINRRAMLILGGMAGSSLAANQPASVISDGSMRMSPPP